MSRSSSRAPHAPARSAQIVILAVFLLDQFTKVLTLRAFSPGESLPLIPSVVHLTYVQNTGAAFGLFKDQTAAFILLSIVVTAWILWELCWRGPHGIMRLWGFSLVIAGALGNLVDRVRLGFVIDMIDLRVWPVFNVADSAITIGVALLFLGTMRAPRQG